VIGDDELAAIAAALALLTAEETTDMTELRSRWKLAARNPDLELEDYRSV
jgi:hypothetical protein